MHFDLPLCPFGTYRVLKKPFFTPRNNHFDPRGDSTMVRKLRYGPKSPKKYSVWANMIYITSFAFSCSITTVWKGQFYPGLLKWKTNHWESSISTSNDMTKINACFHSSSSSRNRLSTKDSISVEMMTFSFFLLTFRSISTIVGLLRSHKWLKVSWVVKISWMSTGQCICHCHKFKIGHYPTNLRINLSNSVAKDVFAIVCWTFSHKYMHKFVDFCRDRHLCAFAIQSNPKPKSEFHPLISS